MRMAMTPSLNASMRLVGTGAHDSGGGAAGGSSVGRRNSRLGDAASSSPPGVLRSADETLAWTTPLRRPGRGFVGRPTKLGPTARLLLLVGRADEHLVDRDVAGTGDHEGDHVGDVLGLETGHLPEPLPKADLHLLAVVAGQLGRGGARLDQRGPQPPRGELL